MQISLKPLGEARKRFAILVVVLGLSTFAIPIVLVDPPVLDRTQWSPWNLLMGICNQQLPVSGGKLDETLVDIALIYLLLIAALFVVFTPGQPQALLKISTVGVALSAVAKWWENALQWTFAYYGHMQEFHMRRGLTWWILPWIMPALLALCFSEDVRTDDADG